MSQLYRTQVLLERSQHRALQALAAAEDRSMSELIREAVAEYLVEQDEDAKRRSWKEAMDTMAEIREEIRASHGVLPENFTLTTARKGKKSFGNDSSAGSPMHDGRRRFQHCCRDFLADTIHTAGDTAAGPLRQQW